MALFLKSNETVLLRWLIYASVLTVSKMLAK